MSRCFPYPPPGYVRNPVVAAAEAEATTKLQKEREKKERKEKKKEKKNDKKALQHGGETSKPSKRTHKKRKHEDMVVVGQLSSKALKESVELLEKSGISEEHGAPCFNQKLCQSPESSQDSSKRRKVAMPSPSQNKNGIRIKIKRDQDSPATILDRPSVAEHAPVQETGSGKMMLKSAAGVQQVMKGYSQAVPEQGCLQPPATVMQRIDPQSTLKSVRKTDPQSSSVKETVGKVDPTPANMIRSVNLSLPKVIGRADPALAMVAQRVDSPPAKVLQRVDPLLSVTERVDPALSVKERVDPPPATVVQRVDSPLSVAQRVQPPPTKTLQRVDPQFSSRAIQSDASPSCFKVLQKETSSAIFHHQQMEQPMILVKPKLPLDIPVTRQQQQQTNISMLKEEPCFSGRKEAAPEVKQSKSERKKIRKAEKKAKKWRDLFVTWRPPSLEMEDMDLGDQDWLLGSRKPDAIMRGCRANDGLSPAQSVEQQFSLQPRAIHLPDLHIYQLPYVVPF